MYYCLYFSQKRMAGILVNQCNLCNKPFSSKMGPSCQNCGKVWECPICNKEFSNRNNYSEHMTSHQPDSNKKEKVIIPENDKVADY